MSAKIRVLVVDDSRFAREVVREIIEQADDLHVIGYASNGFEAVEQCRELAPDIITMDIQMPECDGLRATEIIMAKRPTPILILSCLVDKENIFSTFRCIKTGALDAMEKPNIGDAASFQKKGAELIEKIRMLHKIPVIRHIRGSHLRAEMRAATPGLQVGRPSQKAKALFIGASTGGPQVLREILKELPRELACPIIVVQHISAGFITGMVEWLGGETRLKLTVAEHGEPLRPGVVYFAPDATHCLVKHPGVIDLKRNLPKWNEHLPSVNYLFKSAADTFAEQATGILLSGMGKDGAEGLLEIKKAGGVTIAQNQETSLIFGMPQAAMQAGAVVNVFSTEEIIGYIRNMFME